MTKTGNHTKGKEGFTLIELVVVMALMSVAVSMTVWRLDGLTEHGRLQSTASQILSLVELTRTHAQTSGSPRLIEYVKNQDQLVIRQPQNMNQSMNKERSWNSGQTYELATGVHITTVLLEGTRDASEMNDRRNLRIGADGHFCAHMVILSLHDRYAVVVLSRYESPYVVFTDQKPQTASYDLLMLQLHQIRNENENIRENNANKT